MGRAGIRKTKENQNALTSIIFKVHGGPQTSTEACREEKVTKECLKTAGLVLNVFDTFLFIFFLSDHQK